MTTVDNISATQTLLGYAAKAHGGDLSEVKDNLAVAQRLVEKQHGVRIPFAELRQLIDAQIEALSKRGIVGHRNYVGNETSGIERVKTGRGSTSFSSTVQFDKLAGSVVGSPLSELTGAEQAMMEAHRRATDSGRSTDYSELQRAMQQYERSVAVLSNRLKRGPNATENQFALLNRVNTVFAALEGKTWEPYTPSFSALSDRLTRAGNEVDAAHRCFVASGTAADALTLQKSLGKYTEISALMSTLARNGPNPLEAQLSLLNKNRAFFAKLNGQPFEPLTANRANIRRRVQEAEARLKSAESAAIKDGSPENLLAVQRAANECRQLSELELKLTEHLASPH